MNFIHKKLWFTIGYALVAFVVLLSIMPNPPPGPEIPFFDKIGHLTAYAILMGWFTQLYSGKAVWWRLGFVFVAMGVGIEIVQGLGPSRMFEFADMLANTGGVALGWWLSRGWFAGTLARLDTAFFG